MKKIPIRKRRFHAIIDDDDYDKVIKFNWYAVDTRTNRAVYAVRQIRKENGVFTTQSMHRFILESKAGEAIDHIDGNGLNNQKSNLRCASKIENAYNRGKPKFQNGTSSEYKGVTMDRRYRRWYAYIQVDGKRKFLGYHPTQEMCACAYNAAAIIYHGEFAKLNVIKDYQ